MADEITKEVVEPASAPSSGEAKPVEIVTPSEVIPEPIIQTIEPAVEPVIIPEPVFSPPAKDGELGEGTQVQDSLRPLKSNEWTVPVRESPEGQEVSESTPEPISTPIIIPTENPTPIVIAPAPEPAPASAEGYGEAKPVVFSPLAPLSTLDRISLAFKNNMMHARELLVKAHAIVSARRRKKIDSIINLFLKKKKIKNSDVRDFLHITDETATVYLNILKKEGKIQLNGKGGWVYYTKV